MTAGAQASISAEASPESTVAAGVVEGPGLPESQSTAVGISGSGRNETEVVGTSGRNETEVSGTSGSGDQVATDSNVRQVAIAQSNPTPTAANPVFHPREPAGAQDCSAASAACAFCSAASVCSVVYSVLLYGAGGPHGSVFCLCIDVCYSPLFCGFQPFAGRAGTSDRFRAESTFRPSRHVSMALRRGPDLRRTIHVSRETPQEITCFKADVPVAVGLTGC